MIDMKRLKKMLLGDGDGSSNINHFMKKKQTLIGAGLLCVLLVIVMLLHHASKPEAKKHILHKQAAHADGILSTDFTQKNELSALEQQQKQMDALTKKLTHTHATPAPNHQQLMQQINAMLDAREAKQQSASIQVAPTPTDQPLQTITFQYTHASPKQRPVPSLLAHAKNPTTYVPAGTFAKAVLLQGADANASVDGQSSTTPILVRLLDAGTLPNGRHSHLRGCFVLASVYGDISSERGEARLTTISCTKKNGAIMEHKVEGYISFAGKEGIKGRPVMRNGKILAMAGMSGMLSGIGSSLQQSTQTQSVSPLGATTSINPNKIWQSGAYGGASTAMSQLAGYYIKRANQYHPVIEIGSGTVATVIFQRGFALQGTDDTKSISTPERTAVQSLLKNSLPFSHLS